MTIEEIRNKDQVNDCVACWSCDSEILVKELRLNDGFCPTCNQEISIYDN